MSASVGVHFNVHEGQLLHGRYRVVKEVGCGNFAKVYRCADTRHPDADHVALKILKREYATDASFELEILKALKAKAHGRKVVQMLDHFNLSQYPCFVFKLAGPTLRSRKMGISKNAVNIHDVRRMAHDLMSTLAFLHQDVRMIHTDLKPENILLDDPEPGQPGIGSGFTIADFGSASFWRPERPDSDLISTRPYRAPEVVLGMPWNPKADVWSMACIIFEVYYGGRLFEVHDDHEHLNKFEQRLGKIPTHFARPSKLFRRFFDDGGNVNRRPTTAVSRSISEIVRGEPEFEDLLRKMLHFEPSQRLSAADTLNHPFFTGANAALRQRRSVSSRAVDTDAAVVQQPRSSKATVGAAALTDKENAAAVPSSSSSAAIAAGGAAQCIPGTSIPLPPSSYGAGAGVAGPSLAEQAKAKWAAGHHEVRPAAGMPTARTNNHGGGLLGAPSSRKLF